MNETALFLQWAPPSDTGGRKDVTYNVLCQHCSVEGQACQPCNGDVRFVPPPMGLTRTSVAVQDFVANSNYTFQIEAVNGVSGMGRAARQMANISVSTAQAGECVSASVVQWLKQQDATFKDLEPSVVGTCYYKQFQSLDLSPCVGIQYFLLYSNAIRCATTPRNLNTLKGSLTNSPNMEEQ